MKNILAGLIASLALLPGGLSADPPKYECVNLDDGVSLYQAGCPNEARIAFQRELDKAEVRKDDRVLWQALMAFAWFHDERGEHDQAIEKANRAFEIASKSNDAFLLSRSLCWLGWAYASTGRYEAALKFYEEAVEIAAPEGKIGVVHGWGLALQEIGAIQFKLGNIDLAKEHLRKTTDYARKHGIAVGIAEGGAHLSEIALVEGDSKEAEHQAREAIAAAERCRCSPFNTVRAKLTLVRVLMKAGGNDHRPEIDALLKDVRESAETRGIKRASAEAKILESKLLPSEDLEGRTALLNEAARILDDMQSEIRGQAYGEIGKAFSENKAAEYAATYLERGIAVSEQLLRKVDAAYLRAETAGLESLRGDEWTELRAAISAADAAQNSGAIELAADTAEKVAALYVKKRYVLDAREWQERAVKLRVKMEQIAAENAERRVKKKKRLASEEKLLEYELDALKQHETGPRPS